MRVAADIETDSLAATKIHCIVCKDIDTNEIYTFTPTNLTEFKSFSDRVTHWIGHNFLSFDAPVLNRLAGTSISTGSITDTLILSQMDKPDREVPEGMKDLPKEKRTGAHSLQAWGMRMGDYKIDFHDFSHFSQEMLDYCIQDVNLCHSVYNFLMKRISKFTDQSVRMEHTIRMLIDKQQNNGFAFDCERAVGLYAEIQDEQRKCETEVHEAMKALPVCKREVNLSYKKDGTLAKRCIDPIGDADVIGGDYSAIEWQEFNLGSRQQIARHLMLRGWKPMKHTDKGSIIVDESVLEDVDIYEAQLIARYLKLQKISAMVDNWINHYNHETGCIHGKVMTLGANTNRMTHHSPNIAQTPSCKHDKETGEIVYGAAGDYFADCRRLFTARSDDRVLVGCDASGLELRCLAQQLNTPHFTAEVIDGDVHTANQKMAGLPTRNDAKTFIYALIYGGGPAKIGSIVGGGFKEGKRMIDMYLSKLPALKALRNHFDTLQPNARVKAIDGRLLNIRSNHSALNTLLQGMGAIICKYWLIEIYKLATMKKLDFILVGAIHDEYQFDVHKDHAVEFGEITRTAIKNVEKLLNMNCPLDSEYKVGNNWAETH